MFLVACDLRPAPKQEPKPPPAPPPAPTVAADAAVAPAVPDALADNVITVDANAEPTAECLAVGEHVASLWIDTAKDVAEKAALIQDRSKLVRKTAEACTTLKWGDAMRTCYLNVATVEALRTCADVK
jgi:hypothetical protein